MDRINRFNYTGSGLGRALNLDLSGAILEKLVYNQSRFDHKPEAREAEGGKKF